MSEGISNKKVASRSDAGGEEGRQRGSSPGSTGLDVDVSVFFCHARPIERKKTVKRLGRVNRVNPQDPKVLFLCM